MCLPRAALLVDMDCYKLKCMLGAPVKKLVVAHIHASSRMFGAPVKKSVVAHIHLAVCLVHP